MLRALIFIISLTYSMSIPKLKLNLLQNLNRWFPQFQKTDNAINVSNDQLKLQSTISDSLEDKNKEFEENLHRVYPMLRDSLMKFYFFREEFGFGDSEMRINDLIRSMKREEYTQSSIVINEGSFADKLYIVESGFLDVIIHDNYVRTLQSSDMFGELALLYDAPRSATVISKTNSILWTLNRDAFKKLQDQCLFD
jgi:CRP-like cAMP-binding protein